MKWFKKILSLGFSSDFTIRTKSAICLNFVLSRFGRRWWRSGCSVSLCVTVRQRIASTCFSWLWWVWTRVAVFVFSYRKLARTRAEPERRPRRPRVLWSRCQNDHEGQERLRRGLSRYGGWGFQLHPALWCHQQLRVRSGCSFTSRSRHGRHDANISSAGFSCMVDSKRTGSQSRYVSREMNVLRFSLDAFSFAEATSEVSLYTLITHSRPSGFSWTSIFICKF